MINLIIRQILIDYITFINDFKHQFSPNMEEFEQKSGGNRSGYINGCNYQSLGDASPFKNMKYFSQLCGTHTAIWIFGSPKIQILKLVK